MSSSAPALAHDPLVVYKQARVQAIAQFSQFNRVESLWHQLSDATDALLAALLADPSLTLVAVGGYGRRELFPFSDIDVLVLIAQENTPESEESSIRLVQQLWDIQAMIGHARRTVDESIANAQADASVAASLLDARFIAGDRQLFRQLKKRLKEEVIGADPQGFIATKLGERDRRHVKGGDSRFILEPNIKEGKGGLRDLHTLSWITNYCFGGRNELLTAEEWQRYRQAYRFFSVVRAHMHILRGRADERLTFDLQKEIAGRLKFRGRTPQEKAERLMRRYFQFAREVGTLTRIFCAGLDEKQLRHLPPITAQETIARELPPDFRLQHGRLDFAQAEALSAHPALAVTLFSVAAAQGLDIHPHAYMAVARALPSLSRVLMFEGDANRSFLALLLEAKTPELHLRRMNEAGVLGALIPEFGRIVGMMQYDGYHTYTVDEHIITALGNLAQIEQGSCRAELPLATEVVHEISDRAILYIALLCHDIAKGSGGNHEKKGEAIAVRIAQRMGFNAHAAKVVGWLVREQSLLTEIAFKRDLDDPATIAELVATVQLPERLRLLLLLTVADVKAVGPTIWNGWKGALIRDLYRRAMITMGLTVTIDGGAQASRELLSAQALSQHARDAFAEWQTHPAQAALSIQHDRFHAVTEITCVLAYSLQVFRELAGVMAWIGASIVTARLIVPDAKAAVIMLAVQNAQGMSFADDEERLAPLPELVARAQAGSLDFARELPQRRRISDGREVPLPATVLIDNAASAGATVVEISARDRLGLLYDLLGGFAECGLTILSAQLATYGRKAVDVFYVQNADGQKLTDPAHITRASRVLLDSGNGIALDYAI